MVVDKFEAFSWRGVRKTARNLRIFGQNSGQTPPEYKRESLCSMEEKEVTWYVRVYTGVICHSTRNTKGLL